MCSPSSSPCWPPLRRERRQTSARAPGRPTSRRRRPATTSAAGRAPTGSREGQSSRLFANTLVLQRGSRKVALVAAELFAIPAAMHEDVARRVASLGFDRTSILLQASHTHSGPGGFFPNPTYNTAAPSTGTVSDPLSFVRLLNPGPGRRAALHVPRRPDRGVDPPRRRRPRAGRGAAWGHTTLLGVTQNRSIEAHLANHGIKLPYGKGSPRWTPTAPTTRSTRTSTSCASTSSGAGGTIPIGAWSNFADHGTVVHAELQAYSGDHHAAAWRVFSKRVRRHGHVPARADGGQRLSERRRGRPDRRHRARRPGRRRLGRHAGGAGDAARLARSRPRLAGRPRSTCAGRAPASAGATPRPARSTRRAARACGFLTGSEEGRGPLYDVTARLVRGPTNPIDDPVQGDKYVIPGAGNPPPAVPIAVVRVGDHVLGRAAGRGDQGGRGAGQARAARHDGRRRRAPRRDRGPRRRLRPVHHHARGVRAAELRGRLDALRQERGDVLAGAARRPRRPRSPPGSRRPSPTRWTRATASSPTAPRTRREPTTARAVHQPLESVERLGHASFALAGRAVGARPPDRPRVRRRRSGATGTGAGAPSTPTSGSTSSGASTTRAATTRPGRSRSRCPPGRTACA